DHARLQEYVKQVISWLETGPNATFSDAIYGWQIGRMAMKQRLAIRVADYTNLLNKLKQWQAGENSSDVWSGEANPEDSIVNRLWQSPSGRQLIDQLLGGKDLEQLALLWISGVSVDWQKLYGSGESKPRCISLPTYPFARERYWVDTAVGSRAASNVATKAAL